MEVVVLDPPVGNRRGLPDRGDCALGRSQGDPPAHFRVQEGAQDGEGVGPIGRRPSPWKETFPDTTSALASLDAAVRQEFGRRQRRLRNTSLAIRRGLHPPRLQGDYISRD